MDCSVRTRRDGRVPGGRIGGRAGHAAQARVDLVDGEDALEAALPFPVPGDAFLRGGVERSRTPRAAAIGCLPPNR